MTGQPDSMPKLALISVSDKTGITDFARRLAQLGFVILSTGGTAKALADAGVAVREVSAHTGFPEIMGGRVKTLHPRIHGGLLGRPGEDEAVMREQDIPRISLAVINLYPFEAVTSRAGCGLDEAIENIDIGGPAMVRSAAKNHAAVGIVTDPSQYAEVLSRLEQGAGELDASFRFELAVAAFNLVARYDAAISNYLSSLDAGGQREPFPRQVNGCFEKIMDLRYGENPHQAAAWYKDVLNGDAATEASGLAAARQLQGKELSFNNLADSDAAWACVQQFATPACVIVKHANPCGVALGSSLLEAYHQAYATDPTSAFGGVIAFNRSLDGATARDMVQRQFIEVLIAPDFSPEAVEALAARPNVRALAMAGQGGARQHVAKPPGLRFDLKRIAGGLLIQSADEWVLRREDCRVVSRLQPTETQWEDLLFAWKVIRLVKSNAIVYASGGRTLGIGAGQMSRIDSARIAAWKAGEAGLSLPGSVMASEAFFPFRDSIDTAATAGITGVIQPGGSLRDDEVIAAADEHGMVMVFTGIRHFRH